MRKNFHVLLFILLLSSSGASAISLPAPPEIYTETLDNATVDKSYNFQIDARGALPLWSISDGKLPDGLTLTQDGIITGIPTKKGTFTFTVKLEVYFFPSQMASKQFTMIVDDKAPVIRTNAIGDNNIAEIGVNFYDTLKATGEESITWAVTAGKLPNGLILNTDGTITGTPASKGTFIFTVKAENFCGTDSKEFTIYAIDYSPLIITDSIPEGTINKPYSGGIEAKIYTPFPIVTNLASDVTWEIIK